MLYPPELRLVECRVPDELCPGKLGASEETCPYESHILRKPGFIENRGSGELCPREAGGSGEFRPCETGDPGELHPCELGVPGELCPRECCVAGELCLGKLRISGEPHPFELCVPGKLCSAELNMPYVAAAQIEPIEVGFGEV
jgi:hypothetical protein